MSKLSDYGLKWKKSVDKKTDIEIHTLVFNDVPKEFYDSKDDEIIAEIIRKGNILTINWVEMGINDIIKCKDEERTKIEIRDNKKYIGEQTLLKEEH